MWLLGTICTFAFYQFNQQCASASLIALSAIEFSLIIITLLFVSMLIVKAAKREGDPRALFPSESEQSQYSRKWGSLYSTLKPAVYWFFVLDYQWVVVRSGIVAFGQVVLPKCHSCKTNELTLFYRAPGSFKYLYWLLWSPSFFLVWIRPRLYQIIDVSPQFYWSSAPIGPKLRVHSNSSWRENDS